MTAMGWLFIIVSWGAIIALSVFCYSKLFKDGQDD